MNKQDDEFKLLTGGVILSKGSKSKTFCLNPKNNPQRDDVETSLSPTTTTTTTTDPSSNKKQQHSNTTWFTSIEDINHYRKQYRIYIKGSLASTVPPPVKTFQDLFTYYNVPGWLVNNLESAFHFKIPTPVQMQAIPCLLSGEPFAISAPTGSGKTIAFLVPLLSLLKGPKRCFCRGLILIPTRELGVQIVRELDLLQGHKKFRCGFTDKIKPGQQRLDIGVATPLRFVQLLRSNSISLDETRHVILDEADKLLEMGFLPQIDEIFSYLNIESIQFCFFSATIPENVQLLVDSVVPQATRISIGSPMAAAADINQKLMFVTHEDGKLSIFRQLINTGEIRPPALVFVQSIDRAKELFRELVYDGIFCDAIHADRPKKERDRIIQGFREKKIWVLICTDLMARGVDFKGVNVVVSWDLPQSPTAYIHRIGRTGRAGHQGTAITFYTLNDVPFLRNIVGVMRQSGCDVPEWLLRLKKPSKQTKQELEKRALKRKRIGTIPKDQSTKKKNGPIGSLHAQKKIKKKKPSVLNMRTKKDVG